MVKELDLTELHVTHDVKTLHQNGKSRRDKVPFAHLGVYKVSTRDANAAIKRVEAALIPELIPMRHQRMAASAFAFFRGTAEVMAGDMVHQTRSKINVVASGDAHIGNFGFYASPERRLLFDLNDFDEAGVNSFEFDLKRLLVSIVLAGEANGFKDSKLIKLVERASEVYQFGINKAMSFTTLDRFYVSSEIHELFREMQVDAEPIAFVQPIIKKAMQHDSERVVEKFTTTDALGHVMFRDVPPKSIHVTDETYKAIEAGINDYRQTTRPDVNLLLSNYHVTDIIRHSVGVGSFGTRCYLVLFTSNDNSHLVLQVKEALPTREFILPDKKRITLAQEIDEGQRIIDAQRILQKASDPFLGHFNLNDHSYYVRQFRDMKESIDLTALDWQNFKLYAQACAYLLALSHAQSPTVPAIQGYIGNKDEFNTAMSEWTAEYVNQVKQDYQNFVEALANHQFEPVTPTAATPDN